MLSTETSSTGSISTARATQGLRAVRRVGEDSRALCMGHLRKRRMRRAGARHPLKLNRPDGTVQGVASGATSKVGLMSARDALLDAYQSLLQEAGERATTLTAVAARAGVSKGGLLYHFASKEALAAGLIARLDALVEEDLAQMRAAADGPSRYYVRTSVWTGGALDNALIAVAQLAQESHVEAWRAMRRARSSGSSDRHRGGRGGDRARDPAARGRPLLRCRPGRRHGSGGAGEVLPRAADADRGPSAARRARVTPTLGRGVAHRRLLSAR